MKLLEHESGVGAMIRVITPTQSLVGIAVTSSGEVEASKTFLGIGLIPSDRERMRQWDEFSASRNDSRDARLSDADPSRGLIGVGLARVLGLCAPLGLAGCPPLRAMPTSPGDAAPALKPDIAQLALHDLGNDRSDSSRMPQIELPAATSGRPPNGGRPAGSGGQPPGGQGVDEHPSAKP